MLSLFLILYGGSDDAYSERQYGGGDDSSLYGEDRYSVGIFEYGDGGVGRYVEMLLGGTTDGADLQESEDQATYDGGGNGGLLNLSIPYLGSYEPKYGL